MQIGDKIPEFSLLDQNGVKRSNRGLKSPLVLFFYPKDDTPGCTIEVCGFRDKYDLFKVLGFMDGRVTYVIDRKGTVRHIFRDLLNGPEHIKEAIRVLKEIQNQ